jgi:hypothetical protein
VNIVVRLKKSGLVELVVMSAGFSSCRTHATERCTFFTRALSECVMEPATTITELPFILFHVGLVDFRNEISTKWVTHFLHYMFNYR